MSAITQPTPELEPVVTPPLETPVIETAAVTAPEPAPASTRPQTAPRLRDLLKIEFGLLRARPMLWAALLVVALAPTLYAVSYLSSVWDPYGNLSSLPVGLVNRDSGTSVRGQRYDLGADLRRTLLREQKFNFHEYPTPEAAQAAVRRGEIYFALSIPERFSRDALSGEVARQGTLGVYAAEGTSYFAATLARRFGSEAARGVNDQLSEERWKTVLDKLAQLRDGFKQLKRGVGQLALGATRLETATAQLDGGANELKTGLTRASSGAVKLATGAETLSGGVTRLTDGTGQLSAAVRRIAAQTPKNPDLERLRGGSRDLKTGSAQLATGLGQLETGATRLRAGGADVQRGLNELETNGEALAAGAAQVSAGVQQAQAGSAALSLGAVTLESGLKPVPLPPQARQGIAGVSAGSQNLEAGLTQLVPGAKRLADGETAFNAGLKRASDGATSLATGANTLSIKTSEAATGARALSSGAVTLDAGVQRLTGGLEKLNAGLGQLSAQLPADRDLRALSGGAATLSAKSAELSSGLKVLQDGSDRLQNGSAALKDGAARLRDGLNSFAAKIPDSLETLPGDARGLAASVEARTELTARVPDNGTAFTPYFVVLSLWFGATLTSFVFAFNKLPQSVSSARHPARLVAKFTLPALLVTAQAVMLILAVRFWLHETSFGLSSDLIVLLAGLAFLSLVTALLSVLGDAGRLIAVILLVVQLGAAGGAYPIELAPPFFQAIHPYLPFTSALKALRAAMFGSYDGAWLGFALRVLLTAAIGWLVMLSIGRWRWKSVPDTQYGPALEI